MSTALRERASIGRLFFAGLRLVGAGFELTKRCLAIHGDEWDIECEVRPVDGPEFGAEA